MNYLDLKLQTLEHLRDVLRALPKLYSTPEKDAVRDIITYIEEEYDDTVDFQSMCKKAKR